MTHYSLRKYLQQADDLLVGEHYSDGTVIDCQITH